MTPVKSMRATTMATWFLALKKYRLIVALVASAITKIKPTIEQNHKAVSYTHLTLPTILRV